MVPDKLNFIWFVPKSISGHYFLELHVKLELDLYYTYIYDCSTHLSIFTF